MSKLCDKMPKFSVKNLLSTRLCLIFFAMQGLFFIFYFALDHKLTVSQIRMAKLTCNFDLSGWEPINHTLGVMVYTFAFLGAYIGMYISSGRVHNQAEIFSFTEFFWLQFRLLPCWPLMIVSEMNWKNQSFGVRLIGKYFLPPFLMNLYLFGYSHYLLPK